MSQKERILKILKDTGGFHTVTQIRKELEIQVGDAILDDVVRGRLNELKAANLAESQTVRATNLWAAKKTYDERLTDLYEEDYTKFVDFAREVLADELRREPF